MNGQWVGEYTGSTGGTIIANIDERESNYQGVAYLLPTDNKTFPACSAYFRTLDKGAQFQCRTDAILPINPTSGLEDEWENVKRLYPTNIVFSKYADVTGSWKNESLELAWTSDLGANGSCVLPRSKSTQPSELVAIEKDWEGYKQHVTSLKTRGYLFRGQRTAQRLRTSFHRTGRADLGRFLRDDIQTLRRHLSARTKHIFNLEVGDENGAFLNLVQHHGYPTPLLDWTYSPYVAAFFAYRGISNQDAEGAEPGKKVRIHVFDQQAASTVTNIDDIESYIRSKESDTKRYLSAIDLPVCDRRQVIRDLSYMGITAGSLFPGFDGACEELKERNFEF